MKLGNRKASGPNEIPVELIQHGGEWTSTGFNAYDLWRYGGQESGQMIEPNQLLFQSPK